MHIEKVRVEGFRLLEDVEIMFEPTATVIVGRNNSGKTSLTDVFDRFIGENKRKLRLEDFSAGIRNKFVEAKKLADNGGEPGDLLASLPRMALTLTIRYEKAEQYGPLDPFVIDLDENSTAAIICIEYAASLRTLRSLFELPAKDGDVDETQWFYRCLRESVPNAYALKVFAVDPTDETNTRDFDNLAPLDLLLQCDFVRAQRTLDHAKQGEAEVIGKLLQTLYHTAASATAPAADKTLAEQLKKQIATVEKDIQAGFDGMVKGLLPALQAFGFPSLNDTELRPETSLNVETLLSDHTKIYYTGTHGVHLPEGYNGLGTRNLIYMLLQLEAFHKAYRARAIRPNIHLVFVEEPEAHLHPQMQEVFIKQLNNAVTALSQRIPQEPAWQVQFVVSTHSSHIANTANFDAIRYFLSLSKGDGVRRTRVKDFRKGLSNIPTEDRDFLHQYMTLTKCDLYFADKAILMEGTTERILMPRICATIDAELDAGLKLGQQYISTIEVGGAYAGKFYALLDFLELKSLFVTDVDAVYLDDSDPKKKKRWKKCPYSKGTRSNNSALRVFFDKKKEDPLTLKELAAKSPVEKTSGYRRIAYQIPEPGLTACARSYEDAFILANPKLHPIPEGEDAGDYAWDEAQNLGKTETALQYAIQDTEWNVPFYIREGLLWLSAPPPAPAAPPPLKPGAPIEVELA